MNKLAGIRRDVEKFSQEISKEYYLQGAGLKKDVDFNKIYLKYPGLFTNKNLGRIIAEIDNNPDNKNERRRLRLFLEAFYNEILGNLTKKLVSEYYQKETSGKISIEKGKYITYRSSMVDMLNEKSRPRREKLRKALDEFTDLSINPILEKIFMREKEYVKEMGFKNKVEMFMKLSGINLHELNKHMKRFLSDTEEIYTEVLSRMSHEKLGLKLADLKRHDLMFLMRAREFDSLFPGKQMIKKVTSFVSKMGLDIKANENIVFDLDARPNKSPRAFCSPVRIPDEVYLVIYPKGGEDDYTTFLHELGHALHFANIESRLEFEYKWYGDNSVTEGFAMSFDHLTMNEVWTKSLMGIDRKTNAAYFEHRMMNELIMLRRFAAKIEYETLLHEDDSLEGKRELYSSIFNSATKVQYSPENYLHDVDPNFYCARYLRAWMFQANVHKNMQENYDCNWFENPAAGNHLREMWSVGQKFNADELMKLNGWEMLSTKPLQDNIISNLCN